MRLASVVAFLVMMHSGDVCLHGTRGETARADPAGMARTYDALAQAAASSRVVTPRIEETGWDSRLPACGRATRIVRKKLPRLAGRTFTFGPPPADFVTSARKLSDAYGHGLATPEICALFEIRCAKTTVKVRENELELLEEP